MARISLIIPTHNRAAMLSRAVESAKGAGTDLEIIVVDDASNDETQSIFRDRKDIIYLRMERNVGQAHARNAGIARSTGEYLVFLDDDDLRLPGSLDTQAKILDNDKNLGFVYGQVLIADPQTCLPTGVIKPSDCPTGDIFWDLLRDNFIYIASVMVRKQHMDAIGGFSSDVLGTEDWDAWLRLAAICKVGAVQEPVAIYRSFSRQTGQTSANRPRMCKAGVRTQEKALRLPRALAKDWETRRELKSNYRDSVWDNLVREGHRSLSQRNLYYAALNYITAIRLHPRRAARLGAMSSFTRSIFSRLRD